jgi:hypothetical protein
VKTNKKSTKSELKSGKPKHKIGEVQRKKKTVFLFGFPLIIVWISLFLSLDFPDSFENPGNPNKRLVKSK